jgi:hypothetical protein
LNENLSRYLEVVENNLVVNIQNNFDFFTEAFNNFDGMKEDMRTIAVKAASMRDHNERLQSSHLQKMLKVYYLQR